MRSCVNRLDKVEETVQRLCRGIFEALANGVGTNSRIAKVIQVPKGRQRGCNKTSC